VVEGSVTTFIYVGGTRGDFSAGARYVRVDLVPRDHAKVVHLACGGGWVEYNPPYPLLWQRPGADVGRGRAVWGVRLVWSLPLLFPYCLVLTLFRRSGRMKYPIVYADPPWEYGNPQHSGAGKPTTGGAATHYPTLRLPQLKRLPVASIVADDALLFLWTSSPHLDQAIDLMPAWGFKYVTVGFVWDKQRVNPGYYTMSQVELCLIGKRGAIPKPRGARNVRQLVSELRGEHSAKPSEVRHRIEAMFPTQAKVELFAREATPGWSVWGNEVASDVTL